MKDLQGNQGAHAVLTRMIHDEAMKGGTAEELAVRLTHLIERDWQGGDIPSSSHAMFSLGQVMGTSLHLRKWAVACADPLREDLLISQGHVLDGILMDWSLAVAEGPRRALADSEAEARASERRVARATRAGVREIAETEAESASSDFSDSSALGSSSDVDSASKDGGKTT